MDPSSGTPCALDRQGGCDGAASRWSGMRLLSRPRRRRCRRLCHAASAAAPRLRAPGRSRRSRQWWRRGSLRRVVADLPSPAAADAARARRRARAARALQRRARPSFLPRPCARPAGDDPRARRGPRRLPRPRRAGARGDRRSCARRARAEGRRGHRDVARLLGLRLNHPAADDALELGPNDPATRAEAAYSLARC